MPGLNLSGSHCTPCFGVEERTQELQSKARAPAAAPHLLVVWPWANGFLSLCLSFLHIKVGDDSCPAYLSGLL